MITNLVSGWADGRKNIFMVGDVKQSIYRFRLQDRNFLWRNTTAILLKMQKNSV